MKNALFINLYIKEDIIPVRESNETYFRSTSTLYFCFKQSKSALKRYLQPPMQSTWQKVADAKLYCELILPMIMAMALLLHWPRADKI